MGKRSSFKRTRHDDYPTPPEALEPLIPFLDSEQMIIEPCPGEGILVGHLRRAGYAVKAATGDARSLRYLLSPNRTIFVTNPPWTLEILNPIIMNLSDQAPTWLLLAADWMHLKAAIPFKSRMHSIVSVGRVQWFPNSRYSSLDNAAWYRFDKPSSRRLTRFYGR
jgi:hypothetical protein